MLVPRIQIPGADTRSRAAHYADLGFAVSIPVADDGHVTRETEVPDGIATGDSIPRAVVICIDVPLANTDCRTAEYAERDGTSAEPISGYRLVIVEAEEPELIIGGVIVGFILVQGKQAESASRSTEYADLLEVPRVAATG